MNSFGLLQISDYLNVPVYNYQTGDKKAFCLKDAIALDFPRIENDRECKRLLSEELGHILAGALYPLAHCGNPLYKSNIRKQERKAFNRSLTLQVPLCELKRAIKRCSDDYEIADMLDVDLNTLSKAIEFYRQKGVI